MSKFQPFKTIDGVKYSVEIRHGDSVDLSKIGINQKVQYRDGSSYYLLTPVESASDQLAGNITKGITNAMKFFFVIIPALFILGIIFAVIFSM